MTSDRAAVDPFDAAHRADPYAAYGALRRPGPVRLPQEGFWALTTYADVSAALKDRRLGMGAFNETRRTWMGSGPAYALSRPWMLFRDPPDHTRLRGLVSQAFTPRAVEAMRPRVQRIVDGRIDAALERGRMDAIADFALPVPELVISDMLGVPAADRGRFGGAMRDLFLIVESPQMATPERVARCDAAAKALGAYFHDLVRERRQAPGDDLLSGLIAAEEHGDRLTSEEVVATAAMLLIAGYETTTGLIGNSILALIENPAEIERLRAAPERVADAVEELLRYDSSVLASIRTALADVEIRGTTIRRGESIFLLLGSGNHDPAEFADPDRLDLARERVRPLSFGGGMHVCLGAPLARLEGQVAIATLFRRAPAIALDGDAERVDSAINRIVKRLPLSLRA